MKILIINTYDKGGAANACLRLHEGLLGENMDSKVLLKHKIKELPRTFEFKTRNQLIKKLKLIKKKSITFLRVLGVLKKATASSNAQFLNGRPSGLDKFSFPHSNFDITTSPLYHEADIINLHWVANFLDYESFFKKNTKPVVWTLHDMNPFTGGEHYLETHLGLDASGFPVIRELSEEEQIVSNRNLKLKQNAIGNVSNITVVSPSQWLCNAAIESVIFKTKNVHCIPYGVNSEIYKPRDKNYSRAVLSIPKDKTIVLFVADSINIHRKGYTYLKKAIGLLKRDDIFLCTIGKKSKDIETENRILELGTINDERLMSIAYSAADVFVIPSIMDNFPNTVVESLMCGTPVIGFPIGGIPDMIKHGFNGLLTKEVNSTSLAKSLELYLDTKNSFNREDIRIDALSKYDLAIQAKKYIDLYQSILNS